MTERVGFLSRHPEIPGYEPLRVVGQNGAVVYIARHMSADVLVYLRVEEHTWHWKHSSIYTLSLCDHPNILRVHEIGEVEKSIFYSLEYTDHTLENLLEDGPIDEVKAVELEHAVTGALVYAERKFMKIRNLSPSSIQLDGENTPKLIDFVSFEIPNVSEYMSPEEISNPYPHVSSIIYRIGATLYAMLTGEPPISFEHANDLSEKAYAIVTGPPVIFNNSTLTISKDVQSVVSRCLSKDPGDRYESISEVAEALKSLF
jgi:serine/threonine-protein kinase